MTRLLCCLRGRADMGAALSHPQEGEACDGAGLPATPPTMADVIRERKKKAGGAGLGTLRRRIANATRRPRDSRPDRGCEHARLIRSVVGSWRLAEVFLLCEELEAGAALRDLATQAELAREPAPALPTALHNLFSMRWWCDVELVGAGWSIPAHRAIVSARSSYLRGLLQRYTWSCTRVPLEGAVAQLPREEALACIHALYCGTSAARRCTAHKFEGGDGPEGELDLVENIDGCRPDSCSCVVSRGMSRRGAALLGVSRDSLARTCRYLLDSGELADAKLVFRLEGGCGVAYGFRTALELPCHRAVLAARSRFFRSVMSRRSNNNNNGAVCVDEKVLPRRFARALLHAAYTDQVDLSLIGRNSSLPATTNATSGTSWSGASRGGASTRLTTAGLDDAFQLYEIARFVEMPIVVQGCEDAIVEALTPDTLPHVLRWSAAPHASPWVHRQAMRYLRDEFCSIVSQSGAGISRGALVAALSSPALQASEPAALRAALRWAQDHRPPQPNVVWHTAHSVSRRGARRRDLSDAVLRETVQPLLSHIRLEHIPPDNELLQQLIRRGIVPPQAVPEGGSADAWLGRGPYRPARCFLPYLDEIKALLEEQAVPEAELARARRAKYMQRIPDTLYMVAAARHSSPPPEAAPCEAARLMVSARAAAALRARVRELRAAAPARAALRYAHIADQVHRQIALRAVREMSLPDACADLLLNDTDDDVEQQAEESWQCAGGRRAPGEGAAAGEGERPAGGESADCCRTVSGSGSVRCASVSSAPEPGETSRTGTCSRRDAARSDTATHRSSGGWSPSRRLPDVALAPNANTHLLTSRDYCRPAPWDYGGVVLQLDLGDGATHTPRPGSRAQRNGAATQQQSARRDHAQLSQAMSCLRARADSDELRAALELSVMRAYSSFSSRVSPPPARRGGSAPLPHRADLVPPNNAAGVSARGMRPAAGSRPDAARLSAAVGRASGGGSPARRRDYSLQPHVEYRLEGGSYAGSASTSRGHSPNNYA